MPVADAVKLARRDDDVRVANHRESTTRFPAVRLEPAREVEIFRNQQAFVEATHGVEVPRDEKRSIEGEVAAAGERGGDGETRLAALPSDEFELFETPEAGGCAALAEGLGAVEDDVGMDAELAHEALVHGRADALLGLAEHDLAIGGHDHVDHDVGPIGRRWRRQ